jgi:hypothetical protein
MTRNANWSISMSMRHIQVQPFSNKKAIFMNFVLTCEGFSGKIFRVLKEKEVKQFGEYCASRDGSRAERVETWDRM